MHPMVTNNKEQENSTQVNIMSFTSILHLKTKVS